MKKGKCNIIIIEPSEIILGGLSSMFDGYCGIAVVGMYPDITKFLERSPQQAKADVVVVNPTLVSYSKRNSVKNLFPEVSIVALLYNYINKEVLLQFDDSIDIYDKSSKIIHKLERVAQSEANGSASDLGELSEREKEILVAVVKGMINKEVAELHNISIHTVISHRKNISRKTGIKSVSGLVVYALLNNLIEENDIR